MKRFKTFAEFIFEQGPTFNLNTPADKPKDDKKIVTKRDGATGNTGDTSTNSQQTGNSTDPDQAIMDKLLKVPNSNKAFMYSGNETKPAAENGVAFKVKNTGRTYNFRSKPLTLVVYIDSEPDVTKNIAYSGTYTLTDTEITTKSTDGKITEVITLADAKLKSSNLPSHETAAEKEKSVALNVAATIRANANYWADSNEDTVYNATEAAFYWIVKNNLTSDKAKEFIVNAFTEDAAETYAEMEGFSWSDLGYAPFMGTNPAGRIMSRVLEWKPDWASENDSDTAYLTSKVPSDNSLASYEPNGDDAKKWAETIWSIIDDSWVSADEEVNAILAILVLTPKGLINVDAAWKDLQTLGVIDTNLDVAAAIADEVDSPDAGEIVKRFANALRGKPSEGAKRMLELS